MINLTRCYKIFLKISKNNKYLMLILKYKEIYGKNNIIKIQSRYKNI